MKKRWVIFFCFVLLSVAAFAQKMKMQTTTTSTTTPMKPSLTSESQTTNGLVTHAAIPMWIQNLPLFNTRITYPKGLGVSNQPQVEIWTWKMEDGRMVFVENLSTSELMNSTFYGDSYEAGPELLAMDIRVHIPNNTMKDGKVAVVLVNANHIFPYYCDVNHNTQVEAMYNRIVYKGGQGYPCIIFDINDPHGGYGARCVAIPK